MGHESLWILSRSPLPCEVFCTCFSQPGTHQGKTQQGNLAFMMLLPQTESKLAPPPETHLIWFAQLGRRCRVGMSAVLLSQPAGRFFDECFH